MRRAMAILAVLALAGLALAGCGSKSSSSSNSSSTSTPASSTPAATTSTPTSSSSAPAGGTVEIKMQNIQFSPPSVQVKVGQTIKWTNDDSVAHNVTAKAGASFASSNFSQGGTYTFKATKAGTIAYVCTIHPGMAGTIVVQ
jgi:plastocyanin